MLRFLTIVAVVAALGASAFGAAAALDVDGGAIQAGEDLSLVCDGDGVQVLGWGLETDTGLVSFVRIGGIADNCFGNDLFVNITSNGTKVAGGSVIIDSNTEVVGFTPQAAEAITDLQVFIEGPNGD
jgi:hypothetical protein